MSKWVFKLVVSTIGVFITSWILEPHVAVNSFATALVVALVLSVLNLTLKPVLVVFTLPVTVFSFGLFLFAINALVILAADALIPGFMVANFGWALLFSLILSVVNSLLHQLGKSKN